MDIPHALLLTAGSALFRQTDTAPSPPGILALMSSRLSGFINAMPALNILRKTFPDSRIVLFAMPPHDAPGKDGAVDTGYLTLLEEGIVDDTVEFSLPEILDIGGMMRLRREVRDLGCDMAFVLPSLGEKGGSLLMKIALLRAMGVTRNVYGWRSENDARTDERAHQIFGPLGALEEAGIGFEVDRDVKFPVRRDREARGYVDSIWRACGLEGSEIVAVSPGGAHGRERWPVEAYRRLIDALLERSGVRVVLIGGPEERYLCSRLSRSVFERTYNLAGRLDYPSLAETLRKCALFIGSDSGMGHLASAVGTPCITISSSMSDPEVCGPWNSRGLAVKGREECGPRGRDTSCSARESEHTAGAGFERVLGLARRELARGHG
jgi:ADP-heptose:LPS heptosyltransferase